MKRILVFTMFSALCLAVFPEALKDSLSTYYDNLSKCVATFERAARENCLWGAKETFKEELLLRTRQEDSGQKGVNIFFVAFFRNEGPSLMTVCDDFAVPEPKEYYFTFINGCPLDRKSKARAISVSLFDGKNSVKLYENSDLRKQEELFDTVFKLEKDKRYTLFADGLDPVASYVTVIVSDKEILKK